MVKMKFKMNKEEIMTKAPYTLEDVGGDFSRAAVDAVAIELVEKNVITDEMRYDLTSCKRDAHTIKYYGEIYDEAGNEIKKVIIVVNEVEESVEAFIE